MKRLHTVEGFVPDIYHGPISQCIDCLFRKQTQAPFQKVESLPISIGDIIVSDICGPFKLSIGGYKYFISWLDLSSRFASVDFLKNKECGTVTDSCNKYSAWLLCQKQAETKKIRTDNGGEYIGKEFQDMCIKSGIIYETTVPYTLEHNGITK